VKPYARSRRCKGDPSTAAQRHEARLRLCGQRGIRPGDNDRSDRAINGDLASAGWRGMIAGESS